MSLHPENFVLIVDDEIDLREILAGILKDAGIESHQAANGHEALDFLKSKEGHYVHAILTDINMPEMDGLTMLKKIREMQLDIPVIILTAYGSKKTAVDALQYGAFDFQDKPFDEPRLLQSVKNAIYIGKRMQSIASEINDIILKSNIPEHLSSKVREGIRSIKIMKTQGQFMKKTG